MDVRLAINPETLTAQGGALFSTDLVETLASDPFGGYWLWGLAVACGLTGECEGVESEPVLLGGLGRFGKPSVIDGLVFQMPTSRESAFASGSRGMCVTRVTPAAFKKGWLPDGFEHVNGGYEGRLPGVEGTVTLKSALVGRPLHHSGWDMAAGSGGTPKRTGRFVPRGSTFFFTKAGGRSFGVDEARKLWQTSIDSHFAAGLGYVVPGVWHPETQR